MKQAFTRLFILFFLLYGPRMAFAQFGLPAGFDLKTFQKNEDLAMWFLQYDSAWQSVAAFDHLPSNKDFVCYPDKRGWKVVAGTVSDAGFSSDAGFYQVDNKNNVTKAQKKFDTLLVSSLGRALFNSMNELNKLNLKSAAGWRRFVKVNADQSITVWAFCDADASGTIWYGPELSWYYSPNGKTLMTSKIVRKAPLMAGKAGQTLNLSCPTDKMPTVGTIWLAHKYKMNFTEVNVAYKTGTSTLRYNKAESTYSWEHNAN